MPVKGLLVVLSAPSGTGKTTIIQRVMAADPNLAFSVSHTTRAPRAGEVDGRDYHFVTQEQFTAIEGEGGFVEWAHVHAHRYGTSVAEVDRLLAAGRDVVFDVDYQGGRSLMRRFPDAVTIFVLPPSLAEIRRRLDGRNLDDEATIRLRLNNARVEIATAGEYGFTVINDELDRAVDDVRAILRASRLRSAHHAARIRALVAEEV
jgi:guanylate kinase